MQFAMMRATDGDRIFAADPSRECAGLWKAKMMRVRRGASVYDAGSVLSFIRALAARRSSHLPCAKTENVSQTAAGYDARLMAINFARSFSPWSREKLALTLRRISLRI